VLQSESYRLFEPVDATLGGVNMTEASTHAWCNGEIKARECGAPSVASISFHLGTGVFDGMMAYWNQDHYYIHRVEDHLVRFRQGAARMGLCIPWTVDEMMAGIQSLLELEPKGTQYVRPIAFRGGPELWVTGAEGRPVDVSIFTVRTEQHRDIDAPISCELSSIERISSRSIPGQTKVCGAYVNSLLARRTAEEAGFNDGIMFDREGHLAEASAANVFLLKDDLLMTPQLNPDVFPGITRKVFLEISEQLGIETKEMELLREDLENIDGTFLCSTLMEIRAVSRLGQRELSTAELPTYRSLVNAFRKLTRQ
jgi:branched-chain amino acid aminotransferase